MMEAVSIVEPGKVDIVEIAEPEMGPEDILLDIHYAGLCGSDLSIFRGLMPLVQYPRIVGHEISGKVLHKGANVPDSLDLGDDVMISPYSHCGVCPACRAGRSNTCQFNQTLGIQREGALAKSLAIHYSKVHKSTILNLHELVLTEPLSVGYHAANRGMVTEADTVLIFGCGTIGMGALCACVRKGATTVVVDIDDNKLQHARKMGANVTVNSRQEKLMDFIMDLTDDEGVDVAIEAVGLPETFKSATELVTFAGRVVYIGYTKTEVSYDTKLFVQKELDIRGSRNALHVFPAVIKMLEQREMPFESLISKIYPFAETGQALADWHSDPGAVTKLLIDVKA
jgi:threonine dehydrogenase-like Zn-dependent dehydrogenase